MGHAEKEQITVFTTNGCNLRCKYCAGHSSVYQDKIQKINIEFAKRGISDYFDDPKKHQIRYYSGGETTQAFDIVKETWEYAYSLRGESLLSEMQTNCYFDRDILEWVGEHINIVWASIDGWKEIQDLYRPVFDGSSSYEVVLKNISYLKDKTFVGVRSTIVPETVNKQKELIRFFHGLGINYVTSAPVFEPVKQDILYRQGRITGVDIKEYIADFIDAWYLADSLGMSYINVFMVNFDNKVKYACRSCLPTPHLTTDGYVSACDLGYYGDTPLSDLIYGKYNDENDKIDYYNDRILKLRSRYCENIRQCRECVVKDYCGGGCLGRAYHETRDFFGVIPDYCWATRELAKNLPLDKIKINYLHP